MRDSYVHRLVLYLKQGSLPLPSESSQVKPPAEEKKRLHVPFLYFNAGLVTDTSISVLLKIPLAQMILPEVSCRMAW